MLPSLLRRALKAQFPEGFIIIQVRKSCVYSTYGNCHFEPAPPFDLFTYFVLSDRSCLARIINP